MFPRRVEPLLEVFGNADAEARQVVLDHIAAQETPEADAALTWAAYSVLLRWRPSASRCFSAIV